MKLKYCLYCYTVHIPCCELSLQRFPRKKLLPVYLQFKFYVSCIYLCILLSNTIFVSDGVRVVSLNSTTMGTTSAAGPAYRSTSPRFTPEVQWGSFFFIFTLQGSDLSTIVVRRFVLFILVIVLQVLGFIPPEYPFSFFKLFLKKN